MVTTTATNDARFERFGFAAAIVAICAILLGLGIMPRSERALFLRDDKLLPAKAFSAVVPPLDATQSLVEQSLLRSEDIRRTRAGGPGGRARGAPPQLASASPSLLPGTLPSLLSTGNAPGGSPTGEALPGGLTPTPGPGGGEQSSTTPTTPTTGGNSPSAPGLPTATAGAPAVAAVPEPATWLMMLVGFFAIGAAIRRRPVPLDSERATLA